MFAKFKTMKIFTDYRRKVEFDSESRQLSTKYDNLKFDQTYPNVDISEGIV